MGGIFKKALDPLDLMGNLFGGKDKGGGATAPVIPPPPPPPAPSIDDAAKARDQADQARRRKGRAATLLTGAKGAGLPQTAAKTLLGE